MSEIDKTKSGMEIDALIAENVMGYTWQETFFYTSEAYPRRGNKVLADDKGEFSNYPRYSENIEAAWLVVEKLQAQDFNFELYRQHLSTNRPNDNYHVVFSIAGPFGDIVKYFADAATVPLAICKAALKVIEDNHALVSL